MKCKKCSSKRILDVTAKCSDTFSCNVAGVEYGGYVPPGLGIGSGDYIDFCLCLDCGQMKGKFPLPTSDLERDISDKEIEEFYNNFVIEGSPACYWQNSKRMLITQAEILCFKFGSFIESFIAQNCVTSKRNIKLPSLKKFIKMYRDNNYYLEGDE